MTTDHDTVHDELAELRRVNLLLTISLQNAAFCIDTAQLHCLDNPNACERIHEHAEEFRRIAKAGSLQSVPALLEAVAA